MIRSLTLGRPLVLGVVGLAALIASSQVQVPMWPVPITMQTFVVVVLAGLAGTRVAVATCAAYLALGLAGAPVFAGFAVAGGPLFLLRPSGGYVLGWMVGAASMGWFAAHFPRRPVALFAGAALAHVAIYACGVAWLSRFVGIAQAVQLGVVPFLIGDLVKCALAAALIFGASRGTDR